MPGQRNLRVLGVDPGTKTFDIAVVEGNEVRAEKSIPTEEIAKDPNVLINAIESFEVDYVVGPSGYGVPLTMGNEVIDPRRFAVEVLLLSTEEDIKRGVEAGEVGIWVYDALAKTVEHLIRKLGNKTLFLPGIIHLPTVPWYRRINKVDLGTVDKLAASFVAIYTYSQKEGLSYDKVNAIVAELGFGYNAAIAVNGGKIVDGIGGTVASIGTLTAGALDLEVVAHENSWERWDVFHGGIFYYAKVYDMQELINAYQKSEEPYASLFLAFIEGVAKDVMRARISTPKADIVLLTGRHSKYDLVVKLLKEYLKDLNIEPAGLLKGAVISKEASQGYAAIGEGLMGGFFNDLVKHMQIDKACGTVTDYIIHERANKFKERVLRLYLETVKNPILCR